jgi:replicative DNA helicase
MNTSPQSDNLATLPDSDSTTPYRQPPTNIEIEMALLGAILTSNRAYERVSEFLEPTHFTELVHGQIFAAAGKLIERGQRADPVTLKNLFDQEDALAEVGGAQYLARLAASAVTIINAEDYGRTIHDLFLRRQLIDLGEDVVNDAYDADLDNSALDQIEATEQKLFDLASSGQHEGGFQPFNRTLAAAIDLAQAAYKREGRLTGVTTGFPYLDSLLGGLQKSDLIILAGRPSMGKTALATNIAYNAARAHRIEEDDAGNRIEVEGHRIGFFSLEMSAEQLATRILAESSGVPSDKVRRGAINNDQFGKVFQASQELARLPFFIDDTPALSVAAIRTRARRLKRTHGLDLIVIDYLQLLRPSHGQRPENRVQEISAITRGLKALAKELDVPVLALSQLSRAVEQREDKRPQLADLRESGSIEQDADVVMFIYREEYYLDRQEPPDDDLERHSKWQERMDKVHNLAEIIVAKQRHGPIDKVKLVFQSELTKFATPEPNSSFADADD